METLILGISERNGSIMNVLSSPFFGAYLFKVDWRCRDG
jgi:hypothetical protein